MLKKILKKILRKTGKLVSGIFWYPRDLFQYLRLGRKCGALQNQNFKIFPQVFDKGPGSHTFDKHYVYMDRWAFKHLLESRPPEHVDIGSSIRFLSMASTITKVKFLDIRPLRLDFENFECVEGSLLDLPFADNSVSSVSCLHVAEHVGLGRYGDPLDPQGSEKACQELKRVLSAGGALYFAVPVGRQAIYFNAHRVFDPHAVLNYFSGLKLEEFSAVNDSGHFVKNADMRDFSQAKYSCGLFKFTKNP
ncbi:MAG: DUF268 domain-containing protein [Patescibacteria group bacterium]|nr:DUF268 domain-containing protein [Patescibacteria group bacterium]